MTLVLSHSIPEVGVKSHSNPLARSLTTISSEHLKGGLVVMGAHDIPMEAFMAAALYALTNTNLEGDDDPRITFLEHVKSLMQVEGYDSHSTGMKRLAYAERIVG